MNLEFLKILRDQYVILKKIGVNLQCFVYYEQYGDQLGKFEKNNKKEEI